MRKRNDWGIVFNKNSVGFSIEENHSIQVILTYRYYVDKLIFFLLPYRNKIPYITMKSLTRFMPVTALLERVLYDTILIQDKRTGPSLWA